MATHSSVFLPGESQGRGSLVGCRLWGRTELDTTEATQQQQQQQDTLSLYSCTPCAILHSTHSCMTLHDITLGHLSICLSCRTTGMEAPHGQGL